MTTLAIALAVVFNCVDTHQTVRIFKHPTIGEANPVIDRIHAWFGIPGVVIWKLLIVNFVLLFYFPLLASWAQWLMALGLCATVSWNAGVNHVVTKMTND